MSQNTRIQLFARYVLRVVLVVCILAVLCLLALYLFVQRNPEDLARGYIDELASKSGLEIGFKSVNVVLLPLPGIVIGDLTIKDKDFLLEIALLNMMPGLNNLLHGDFMPAHISIVRPKLFVSSKISLDDPAAVWQAISAKMKSRPQGGAGRKLEDLLPHECAINLLQGETLITGSNRSRARIRGLKMNLSLSNSGLWEGQLEFTRLSLIQARKLIFALDKVRAQGERELSDIFDQSGSLGMSGRVRFPKVIKAADFKADFEFGPAGWLSSFSLKGDMDFSGEAVPASYSGRFLALADSPDIDIRDLRFSLDADSGKLDLKLRLPQKQIGWALTGSGDINRLSLTQWLGFARNLPPGLQQALDNIHDASFAFQLDRNSLAVKDIKATSTGAYFTGSGGVADFAKPVVKLDLSSDKVNLGQAVPESLVKSPVKPRFFFPPLTPLPGKPLEPGETGVDYDVRLAAKNLIYGSLLIQNASLRIHPGQMDRIRLEDVLLDGSGDFYAGKISGRCILGADPSLPININFKAKNIDGQKIARAMPVLPFRQGIFNADGDVFSKGKTLKLFLANLDGPLNLQAEKVSLQSREAPAFKKIVLNMNVAGAKLLQKEFQVNGKWKGEIKLNDFSAHLDLNGNLNFSSAGLILRSIPASLKFTLDNQAGFLPRDFQLAVKGQLSGNSGANKYSLNQFAMQLPGLKLGGDLTYLAASQNVQGQLEARVSSLKQLLAAIKAPSVNVPEFLNQFSLDTELNASLKEARLAKIRLVSADTNLTGSLTASISARPNLKFNLTANTLDMERQFKNGSKANSHPDFGFLRDFDSQGTLKITTCKGWDFVFNNLSTSISLQKGKLDLGPASANFCGALVNLRINADFNPRDPTMSAVLAAHNFNLEQAAKERKIQGILKGNASLDARINGQLGSNGDILAKLNGNWDIKVYNGLWQSRDAKGQPKGSATNFQYVGASGALKDGRLESGNLLLRDKTMQVSGSGWLNLISQKIDLKLNVNMNNLPDFPLYVYGPLAKPTTSIGAGKMMLNAIGGLASGIGNIFGGMIEGVGNLFK